MKDNQSEVAGQVAHHMRNYALLANQDLLNEIGRLIGEYIIRKGDVEGPLGKVADDFEKFFTRRAEQTEILIRLVAAIKVGEQRGMGFVAYARL